MKLALSIDVDAIVAAAERAVRDLNRGAHQDLDLVARFLLRSEAIASSYIEGIASSPRDVALAELALDEDVKGLSDTAQDVARNMAIVRDASDALSRKDAVAVADIEDLQTSLIPGPPDLRGQRSTQNWIGGSAYHPLEAAHVPPPPGDVTALLEDLVQYMAGAAHSPIVQAALVHAQFETIHPFPDGNGRVGRALIHTVLTRRGLTAESILPVSLVLATLHAEYIAGLETFRFEGEADSPRHTTQLTPGSPHLRPLFGSLRSRPPRSSIACPSCATLGPDRSRRPAIARAVCVRPGATPPCLRSWTPSPGHRCSRRRL